MRKFRSVVLLYMVCSLLTSCSNDSLMSDGERQFDSGQNGDHRIILEFWHTYSDIETEVLETKVIPLFEQENPDIKIHAVRKDYTDQLEHNIIATVADNKQPDVMRMDIIWLPKLAKDGILVNLSEMRDFDLIKNRFIGSLIKTTQYRGQFYGLPVNATTKTAIYNLKLLKEAGLNAPPLTFDELIKTIKYLQSKHSIKYGIGMCCSSSWGILPYFWTLGGKLTDEEYTHANGYLNHPNSIAALVKLKQWYDERIIGPSVFGGEPGAWEGILKGNLLMIDEGHWFNFVNSSGDNKDLIKDTVIGRFPSDVNSGTSIIGGENLVIFKESKHKQEAWKFMKWMVTEEPQKIMATTGLIPTILNIQVTNQNPMSSPYLEQLNNALPRPPVSTWSDIDEVYTRMIELILTNEQSIHEAVDDAVIKIDALLASQ